MDVHHPSMEIPLLVEMVERGGYPKADEETLMKIQSLFNRCKRMDREQKIIAIRCLLKEQVDRTIGIRMSDKWFLPQH